MDEVEDKGREDEAESFSNYWGWFGVLVVLSNEDITKIEKVTEYPLIYVLNYLTYMKDIQEIKQRELMKQQIKNRL